MSLFAPQFFCYTYAKQSASDDIGSLAAWKLSRSYHTFDFCLLLLWLTLEWMRCFLFLVHDDYISGLGWLDIDSIDNTGLVAAGHQRLQTDLIVYITSHKYICSIFLSLSLTLFIGFFIFFHRHFSCVLCEVNMTRWMCAFFFLNLRYLHISYAKYCNIEIILVLHFTKCQHKLQISECRFHHESQRFK